ncbi:MAG: efflux RND transporter permease subunit [Balneola sp.]|nr:MAG: efflux RND transporter permease subunit [Balneola sp.]
MKKFNLTGGILKRPITVIMVTIITVGFGIFSLTNLRVTLNPEYNIPILAVSTGYTNVAPEDINRILVEPIEGALSGIEGIESLEARISRGSAFIIMRLYEGTNIRKTELKVQKAIDQIRDQIPEQAREPVVFQFDPDNQPIMQLSINSDIKGLDELRNLAIDLVEPRLERIVGLASAETQGGLERRIYVDVTPMQLAQHKLVPDDIESAIRDNNAQLPVGNVVAQNISYSVRAQSMYNSVEEIANTIVTVTEDGIPVRVKDVATVSDGFTEVTNFVRVNGRNSVSVEVQKNSDANTLDVVNAVKAIVPEINEILPPGTELRILSDQGRVIDESISNLSQSALIALFVVILVIVIFMGGWRISAIVAVTIPVSIAASFAAMYATDLTLNTLTISALALAIGLLVDNAIVVTESIARKLEEGFSRYQAALTGTNEVIGALLGSTLTTLGVFIPIIMMTGFQADLLRDFALTICFAIGMSFISSVVIVPVLSVLLLDGNQFNRRNFMFKAISKMEKGYSKVLNWFLHNKWLPTALLAVIVVGTFYLFNTIEKEGFPETDSGEIDISVRLPEGSKLQNTYQVMNAFYDSMKTDAEIETIVSSIGRSRWVAQSNTGRFSLALVSVDDREISTIEYAAKLRQQLTSPGTRVNVSVEGGNSFGGRGFRGGNNSIRLTLVGPDISVLTDISSKIENRLLEDPTVVSVDNGRTDPTPELQFMLDRERINKLNTTTLQIANALRTQTLGNQAGFYRTEGREIPIEVRTSKDALTSRDDLFDLELAQFEDQRIPVMAVGNFEQVQGVDGFSKRNREILLDVNIQVTGSASEYRPLIIDFLENEVVLPDGYRYDFTGATSFFQSDFSDFLFAGLAAIVLMFMIMASLFENFRDPFVIWLCIFMAMFGALMFLFFIGETLSQTAQIGLFMLVGIIVNNGIVLVDYMHLYTKGRTFDLTPGSDFMEAILEACTRRMRPILLTAITTVCSMIPLSLELGAGAEIWSPLAKTVIGGLSFGVIFTLFITPAISVGFKQVIIWFRKLFRRREKVVQIATT